jgi:MFS family permease
MTASPLAMLVTAPLSGYLSDRFGPRPFTIAGLSIAASGLFLLSRMDPGWTSADLYWRLALLGAGWGLFNSPNVSTIMSAVPRAVAGITGGLNAVVRNLANTVAVALAAAYFHWQSGGRSDVDSLVYAYQATLIVAAALAVVGLVPAWLRRVPDLKE